MELRRHAQGTPGHAYPRSSAWNSGVQDHFYKMLKYMFLVSLQWNSGSTTHNQAQGTHIKWQARWCKSQWNSASRRIIEKFSKFWLSPMELRFSRSLLLGSHAQGSLVNSHWNSGFTDPVCIEELHIREHVSLCKSQSNSISSYTGGGPGNIQNLDFFPWNSVFRRIIDHG